MKRLKTSGISVFHIMIILIWIGPEITDYLLL